MYIKCRVLCIIHNAIRCTFYLACTTGFSGSINNLVGFWYFLISWSVWFPGLYLLTFLRLPAVVYILYPIILQTGTLPDFIYKSFTHCLITK